MKRLIMLLLTLVTLRSVAQEIAGRILDEKKEPMIAATVQIFRDGVMKGGITTDFDGNYSIKPLDPGYYDVLVIYTGYDSMMVTRLLVIAGRTTTQNFNMHRKTSALKTITIASYKVPLVDQNRSGGSTILTREQIAHIPTTQVTDLVSTNSNVYQSNRGSGVHISGSRTTQYVVDGVVVRGVAGIDMAQSAVYYNPSEESYKKNPENDFMNVKANPLSTMSVDVDRASYSNVRRFINQGQHPPADAVRVEEMINYFDYDYPQPGDEDPISINTELVDCPWQKDHKLLRIGMQARKINTDKLPPSNLVFLVDVSGSMESQDKLPLLIEGMKLLVQNLRAIDKVAIVTYAGAAGLVLPPADGKHKQTILDALDKLTAGGSTAGGAGIRLAYKVAQENFIKGGNNRVILATDGDFNVGVSNENELEDLITKQRQTGIFLTCLGFGTGNYKDAKMELLADKGNGNYDYVDNIQEAQKVLVSEFGGTLFTIAKDVKAQIEFNPSKVQGYRLVGYENRLLNNEDFKDDKKDAGDMGAGHTVTIMYEVIPTGISSEYMRDANDLKYQQPKGTNASYSNELATIKFRYKNPDGDKSTEIVHTIANKPVPLTSASENTRFAASVAMFGMLLKDSKYKGSSSYNNVVAMASDARNYDREGYRAEFLRLVKAAKEYKVAAE